MLTPDQKTQAIKAAAEIVTALIKETSAFKSVGPPSSQAAAAGEAFKTVFEKIKSATL